MDQVRLRRITSQVTDISYVQVQAALVSTHCDNSQLVASWLERVQSSCMATRRSFTIELDSRETRELIRTKHFVFISLRRELR